MAKERTSDVYVNPGVTFEGMLLSEPVLAGLKRNGFTKPSPIQLKSLPMGRLGFDLIMQAKSGTGKTLAFGIIALESLIGSTSQAVQVLIVTPTREIAVQIEQVLQDLSVDMNPPIAVHSFIGGVPIQEDIKKLKNCQIAVGAPGRLKSLVEQKHLRINAVRLFILDEADKLLSDSFLTDWNYIYENASKNKQIIASSATFYDDHDQVLKKYMHTPVYVSPNTGTVQLLGIKQFVSVVDHHPLVSKQQKVKLDEIIRIFSTISFKKCIIFCNYQLRAESLSNYLNDRGWPSSYVSAALTQPERLKIIAELKQSKLRILVSTDLFARGIDADNVDMVINHDIPSNIATYMHRIGRAGRFGLKGLAITLCSDNAAEIRQVKSVMRGNVVYRLERSDWTREVTFDVDDVNQTDESKRSEKSNGLTKVFDLERTNETEKLTENEMDLDTILTSLSKIPCDKPMPSFGETCETVKNFVQSNDDDLSRIISKMEKVTSECMPTIDVIRRNVGCLGDIRVSEPLLPMPTIEQMCEDVRRIEIERDEVVDERGRIESGESIDEVVPGHENGVVVQVYAHENNKSPVKLSGRRKRRKSRRLQCRKDEIVNDRVDDCAEKDETIFPTFTYNHRFNENVNHLNARTFNWYRLFEMQNNLIRQHARRARDIRQMFSTYSS